MKRFYCLAIVIISSFILSIPGEYNSKVNVGAMWCQSQTKHPSWTPKTKENSYKYPAVVHCYLGWGEELYGQCTGFIADRDQDRDVATIITCAHGYKALSEIYIKTQDGRSFKSKIVYIDPIRDLCIIQIKDPGITPIEIEDQEPYIGDKVRMVGFDRSSVTLTISEGKTIEWYAPDSELYSDYISSDCDAQPGCSGGPVLSSSGKVLFTVTGHFGNGSCVGPVLSRTLKSVK